MVPPRREADHCLHTPHTFRSRTMNLSTPIPAARSTRVLTPLRDLALLPLLEDPAPADAAGDFSRCGWFDSSLELAAGLQVIEFVDALPAGLPFELA
jgi:hypothetical protein